MTSFFNDVNNWLSVGGDLDLAYDMTGQDFTTTIQQMLERGVTHVIDARIEWNNRSEWVDAGLPAENYYHAPIDDKWGYVPEEQWYNAVEEAVTEFWLNSAEGDRLYIHCHMGINRAPSAAMLALLTVDPEMHPWQAFLTIREARPMAGIVYAEAVGARHIAQSADGYDGDPYAEIDEGSTTYAALGEFVGRVDAYWTPELRQTVRKGIAYYRTYEGGTKVVSS